MKNDLLKIINELNNLSKDELIQKYIAREIYNDIVICELKDYLQKYLDEFELDESTRYQCQLFKETKRILNEV